VADRAQEGPAEHEGLVREMTQLDGRKRQLARERQELEARLPALEELVAVRAQQRDTGRQNLATMLADAEAQCSREEFEAVRAELVREYGKKGAGVFASAESIMRECERLTRKYQAAQEELGGAHEALAQRYREEKEKYEVRSRPLTYCKELKQRLEGMLDERKRQLGQMERETENMVRSLFQFYMRKRKNNGSIRLDRDAKTLQMSVKFFHHADAADKGSKGFTDMKSLSGGEKSFTLSSFLLALGHFMESPFRAMDELDVGMDPINRRITIATLLETAYEKSDLQFIFISPQDLSVVEDAKQQFLQNIRKTNNNNNLVVPDNFVKIIQFKKEGGGAVA
jgi:structural maintenance of chromosomes protein 6